jgi:hypothetical protein
MVWIQVDASSHCLLTMGIVPESALDFSDVTSLQQQR